MRYSCRGSVFSEFLGSFRRYCGIFPALQCVDPSNEGAADSLSQKSRRKELFIPKQSISIDEREVKSKRRFSFKQYIRNKPTKLGFRLWVSADSDSDFNLGVFAHTKKQKRMARMSLEL